MNKKGFTLVEVTISIILLLLLALLLIPNIVNVEDSSKDKLYESKLTLALNSAYKYGTDNIDLLSNECTNITIGDLIDLEYLSGDDKLKENLIHPITGESMNNINICIYYNNNEVRVKVEE